MTETTAAVGISTNKFHSIFGKEIGVALEGTFGAEDLRFPEGAQGLYNRDLVCNCKSGTTRRVYHPAICEGDFGSGATSITIKFIPWVENQMQFYRLCFRLRSLNNKDFRWVRLGRFGEQKAFAFNPEKPFINLDFFSRGAEFRPLFLKIQENGGFKYLMLEASEPNEENAMLTISQVGPEAVPPCLAEVVP